MDRSTTYATALGRSDDFLSAQQYSMVGLGYLIQAVLGSNVAVDGFACTPTTPASLSVNLAPGSVYQPESVESTTWSGLPANTAEQTGKQGIMHLLDNISLAPPTTLGFSQVFLIEAQYADLDTAPVLLPYFNAQNPAVPFQGPGGSGVSQNTQRLGIAALQIKAGAAATTGTQVAPTADAGWTGLWYITLSNGQTTITSGNITLYPNAPFIPAKLPAIPADVQNNAWIAGAVGGSVNVYTLSINPAPAAYVQNMSVLGFFGTTNTTTTPTINVNGLGPKTIVKQGGGALATGDLVGFMDLIFDGTNFRVYGLVTSDVGGVSGAALLHYGVDTGSANALVATVTPTITSLVDGMMFEITPNNNNTIAGVTLNVNGQGAKNCFRADGSALVAKDIIGGRPSKAVFMYDATNNVFVLTNPATWNNSSAFQVPQVTIFTAGQSGNYNAPSGAISLFVELVGAGGSGSVNTIGGNAGGNTTFGSLTGSGGTGGIAGNGTFGSGGAASGGDVNNPGQRSGLTFYTAGNYGGGCGGAAAGRLAGVPGPFVGGPSGSNGVAGGIGCGGSGGGFLSGTNPGQGGGGGGSVEKLITAGLGSAFAYSVGNGGSAIASSVNSGAGGGGMIRITAYFQ